MNTCSECKDIKDPTEFSVRSDDNSKRRSVCKQCERPKSKAYREANRVKILSGLKEWKRKNPDAGRKWKFEKYKKDPRYRIEMCLRSRLYQTLQGAGAKRSAKTKELLGCPVVWLEVHLESQFKDGMNWENQGRVWHIDHIKPCAKFDLTDPEQQRVCFHWTNLQPLFAVDNLRKSAS